jgi:hypothetical protein
VVGDTTIQYFVIHVRYKLTVLVSFDESIFASGGCVRWSEDKGVFFFLEAEGVLFGGESRGGVAEDGGRFGGSRGVIEGLGRTVEGLLSNWQEVIGSE